MNQEKNIVVDSLEESSTKEVSTICQPTEIKSPQVVRASESKENCSTQSTKIEESVSTSIGSNNSVKLEENDTPEKINEYKRNKCVKELLSTEKSYVRGLEVLVKIYLEPLQWNAKNSPTPFLNIDKVTQIFCNLLEIYNINKILCKEIEERVVDWNGTDSKLGDIFIKYGPFLKLYIAYCNTYEKSSQILAEAMKNPKFEQFIENCTNHPDVKGVALSTYLITPLQMIPRYILLLKEIREITNPNHIDYTNLGLAVKVLQSIADNIDRIQQARLDKDIL